MARKTVVLQAVAIGLGRRVVRVANCHEPRFVTHFIPRANSLAANVACTTGPKRVPRHRASDPVLHEAQSIRAFQTEFGCFASVTYDGHTVREALTQNITVQIGQSVMVRRKERGSDSLKCQLKRGERGSAWFPRGQMSAWQVVRIPRLVCVRVARPTVLMTVLVQ